MQLPRFSYVVSLVLPIALSLPPAAAMPSKAEKLKNECISLLKAKGLNGLSISAANVKAQNGIQATVKVVARYRALSGMTKHAVVTCANVDLAKGGRAVITEEDIGY
jgi:hypothetical protein